MEYDILNSILTDTVGSIFEDQPLFGGQETSFKTYSPQIVFLSNNPTQQQQQPGQFQQNYSQQQGQSKNMSQSACFQSTNPFLTNAQQNQNNKDYLMNSPPRNSSQINNINDPYVTKSKLSPFKQAIHRPFDADLRKTKEQIEIVNKSQTFSNNNSQSFKQQQPQQQQEQLSQRDSYLGNKSSIEDNKSVVVTSQEWCQIEGPKIMHESLKRLNVDLAKVTKRDLEIKSLQELEQEKKNVKNELKYYDNSFQAIFGKMPQRQEKEPLRPLYIYYKKLKQYIQKRQEEQKYQKQQNYNNISNNNNQYQLQQQQSQTQFSQQQNTSLDNNSYAQQNKQYYQQQQQSTSTTSSQQQYSNRQQVEKKLKECAKLRQELKEKLHKYQNEFTAQHNRKIRFHKDIEPVQYEYQKYKDIKIEIQQLESQLKNFK